MSESVSSRCLALAADVEDVLLRLPGGEDAATLDRVASELARLGDEQAKTRFWVIENPVRDEPFLPAPASARGGAGPFVVPIVDEVYGGVIAWGNTLEQAGRIVAALALLEARG